VPRFPCPLFAFTPRDPTAPAAADVFVCSFGRCIQCFETLRNVVKAAKAQYEDALRAKFFGF
jgi:hypothetical protein